jgi:hypothetical protein
VIPLALRVRIPAEAPNDSKREACEMRDLGKQSPPRRANSFSTERLRLGAAKRLTLARG